MLCHLLLATRPYPSYVFLIHNLDQGVMEGMRAIKTLTKGLKLMSKGKKGRIFEKLGGYSVAIEDFDRVKPRNVFTGDRYWVSSCLRTGIVDSASDRSLERALVFNLHVPSPCSL